VLEIIKEQFQISNRPWSDEGDLIMGLEAQLVDLVTIK